MKQQSQVLHVELIMVKSGAFLCALSQLLPAEDPSELTGSLALLLDTFHPSACKYDQ